jgi:hypothetical protein
VQRSAPETSGPLLIEANNQGVVPLLWRQLEKSGDGGLWPEQLRAQLASESRAHAMRERVRGREIARVLDVLAAEGVRPVLLKGTALAYSVYEDPSLRPRSDTDLLVAHDQIERVRSVMGAIGYSAPLYCDGELLFCQFEMARTDALGVVHAFDFHWNISTQAMFSHVLTVHELVRDAVPVPALGSSARAAGAIHALLLACVHPAMHHRNERRLIWSFDVHLLAAKLSESDWVQWADLAVARGVAGICLDALNAASRWWDTAVPGGIAARLASIPAAEPSAVYLQQDRRWHDEVISNLRGCAGWGSRVRLAREILFPSPAYMRGAYGLRDRRLAAALLPVLYLHRGAHGAWNVLLRRK